MESLRSTHARLAALVRHRAPDDPEVTAARAELERCKEQTRAVRTRISSVPPTVFEQLLTKHERASAGV